MDVLILDKLTYLPSAMVQQVTSVEWIERYQEPGEFTIVTEPTADMRSLLTLGTLITHSETYHVMMIEDHQIDESIDQSPVLTVTGRSLFAFLENRMATGNNFGQKNPSTDDVNLYSFAKRKTVENTVRLIQEHIVTPVTSNSDALPNTQVTSAFYGTDDPKEMVVKRGQLYREVLRLLEEMDAGIKTIRPSLPDYPCRWVIHKGRDLSSTIIFAADFGDLTDTKYFWSIKKKKNSALVTGAYDSFVMRDSNSSGFDMRVLYVDAGDYDFNPIDANSLQLEAADNILARRGNEELAAYKEQTLMETKISGNTKYRYRIDYDIGDIVWVKGNYNVSQKMRVVEFAEFEDKDGKTGIPTLKAI